MEKLQIPKLGREEEIDGIRYITMEPKESVIIEVVNKVNEIIDQLALQDNK